MADRAVTAAAALLALSIAGHASAEICLDVDVRYAGPDPPRVLVRSMQDEAATIWKRYGVKLQWPSTAEPGQCPRAEGSFDVTVEYGLSEATASPEMVLGTTQVMLSAIDRAPIQLHYGATEHVLGYLKGSGLVPLVGHTEIRPADLGRALGRVLAHEIGHVVLGAPNHQRNGLMRSSFAASDLVRHQRWAYTLSRGELERLRHREEILRRDARAVARQRNAVAQPSSYDGQSAR